MELDAKLYFLCRLEIANVDARDMGTYKAVARNASGEGHATINLTFEEGSGGAKIPDGIPPRFPKKPSIKQVKYKSYITGKVPFLFLQNKLN